MSAAQENQFVEDAQEMVSLDPLAPTAARVSLAKVDNQRSTISICESKASESWADEENQTDDTNGGTNSDVTATLVWDMEATLQQLQLSNKTGEADPVSTMNTIERIQDQLIANLDDLNSKVELFIESLVDQRKAA